ncbi:MAG TPA: DUF47 family protein [Firmicutes bacterium]|nr:DUF47 family protein [Bacillota bacterium]
MAKKQDSFYFENFTACMDHACQAAQLLHKAMQEFQPQRIEEMLDDMHAVEHTADGKKHELLNALAKAFITPIEREDILLMSQNIDDVTDQIEDVLLRMYCNNVQSIRPEALALSSVLIRCCEEAKAMVEDFADFKRRAKELHSHIIQINTLEEEADQLFINSLRNLHTTCDDPIQIIIWREIYIYLERCVDACEHVADTVESVVMKNS